MSKTLAALLPLAAMGLTNGTDHVDYKPLVKVGTRKSQLSNKEWQKRKKRISNEKHARAINRN